MVYNPVLDGIRGLAVVFVVLFHARVPYFSGGFLGVDLFFVLSGYLITTTLVDRFNISGRIDFKDFLVRRIRRLLPAFIFFLLCFMLFTPLLFQLNFFSSLRQTAISSIFLANYTMAFFDEPSELGHTWSLAVEIQFYLMWASLLALHLKRYGSKDVFRLCLWIFLLTCLWRMHNLLNEVGWRELYYRGDLRLTGFFAGAALASWQGHKLVILSVYATFGIFIFAMLSLFLVLRFKWGEEYWLLLGILLVELIAVCLIFSSYRFNLAKKMLGFAPLRFIGKISYSWYLWHYPLFVFARDSMKWHELLLIWGIISLLVATFSYYVVEKCFIRQASMENRKSLIIN